MAFYIKTVIKLNKSLFMTLSGPIPEKPSYQSDFQRSVDLFEKSFDAMQKAKFEAQKEQYVKVMHESLQAMQDAATAMVNQKLQDLKQELSHDLEGYLKSPSSEEKEKIERDIDQLKEGG